LQASGQEAPDWCEGRVLPSFGPETNAGDRSLFVVEAKSNPKMAPLTKASIALINGSRKLIHYLGYPECPDSWELYDLTDDPGERHNQYSPSDPVAETLRSELEYRVNQATVALSEQ